MDSNNDEENFGPTLKPNNQNNGYDYSFGYNVNLEGKAEVRVLLAITNELFIKISPLGSCGKLPTSI